MSLPQQILPQTVPLGKADANGSITIDTNWYLFLYSLASQVFSASGGSVPASTADLLQITENDVSGIDALSDKRALVNALLQPLDEVANVDAVQDKQQIINALLIQPDADVSPTLRDMANALLLAQDALLQDPVPQAQPVLTITVGVSPYTYAAPFSGCLSVTGGTVSLIQIIRQGTTIATGMTAGLIQVSKLDQVKITYSVIPTVVFLPT